MVGIKKNEVEHMLNLPCIALGPQDKTYADGLGRVSGLYLSTGIDIKELSDYTVLLAHTSGFFDKRGYSPGQIEEAACNAKPYCKTQEGLKKESVRLVSPSPCVTCPYSKTYMNVRIQEERMLLYAILQSEFFVHDIPADSIASIFSSYEHLPVKGQAPVFIKFNFMVASAFLYYSFTESEATPDTVSMWLLTLYESALCEKCQDGGAYETVRAALQDKVAEFFHNSSPVTHQAAASLAQSLQKPYGESYKSEAGAGNIPQRKPVRISARQKQAARPIAKIDEGLMNIINDALGRDAMDGPFQPPQDGTPDGAAPLPADIADGAGQGTENNHAPEQEPKNGSTPAPPPTAPPEGIPAGSGKIPEGAKGDLRAPLGQQDGQRMDMQAGMTPEDLNRQRGMQPNAPEKSCPDNLNGSTDNVPPGASVGGNYACHAQHPLNELVENCICINPFTLPNIEVASAKNRYACVEAITIEETDYCVLYYENGNKYYYQVGYNLPGCVGHILKHSVLVTADAIALYRYAQQCGISIQRPPFDLSVFFKYANRSYSKENIITFPFMEAGNTRLASMKSYPSDKDTLECLLRRNGLYQEALDFMFYSQALATAFTEDRSGRMVPRFQPDPLPDTGVSFTSKPVKGEYVKVCVDGLKEPCPLYFQVVVSLVKSSLWNKKGMALLCLDESGIYLRSSRDNWKADTRDAIWSHVKKICQYFSLDNPQICLQYNG